MTPQPSSPPAAPPSSLRLGGRPLGWTGRVVGYAPTRSLSIPWQELERRLLEMGFVEGARLELLQQGPIGGDPIAVRVDDITVAVRRRDADVILVSDEE